MTKTSQAALQRKFQNQDVQGRLEKQALVWAKYMKLGTEMKSLIPRLNLRLMYKLWVDWKNGRPSKRISPLYADDDIHGVIKIRNGRPHSIAISNSDPPERQLITLVHELIHMYLHPAQPAHSDVHALSVGLSTRIFPTFEKQGGNFAVRSRI